MGDGQNTIILVDWEKAEEDPTKRQKVQGQLLLDLRTRCEFLKEKLELAEEKIINLQNDNNSITGELEKVRVTNKKTIEEKEGIIKNLSIEIVNITKELTKSNNKANDLAFLLEEKETELLTMSTTSREEISKMKSELETAYDKISELNNSLSSANSTFNSKDEEISKLKVDIIDLDMQKSTIKTQIKQIKSSYNIEKDSEIQKLKNAIDEKEKIIEAQSLEIKEVKETLELLEPLDIGSNIISIDERVRCPQCSAVGKDIKSVDDKKKVLGYPDGVPLYAKKNICIKCGYEDF